MPETTSLKIYLSCPTLALGAALAARDRLRRAGFAVTSRWLDAAEADVNPIRARDDLDAADVFVGLVLPGIKTGLPFEAGRAVGRAMPVFLVGDAGLFSPLATAPEVTWLPTLEALLEALATFEITSDDPALIEAIAEERDREAEDEEEAFATRYDASRRDEIHPAPADTLDPPEPGQDVDAAARAALYELANERLLDAPPPADLTEPAETDSLAGDPDAKV
jgi:hypothetical protein